MERYLMVLVANRISNETTYSDLQQFLEGGFCTQKDDDCNNSSCVLDRHRTHYISIVFPDAQHSQLAEWRVITQSSDVQCVELLKEFNTDDVTSEIDSKYLDDTLHGLADKLPVTGSFLLDVVWIFDASYFPIHEHLYLFGSLRRLQEWHNANITVLCTSDSQTAITSWVSYLNATCRLLQDAHINDMCLCTRRDVVWKGTVTLHESKGVNSVAIPGFVLTRCSEEMDKHDSKFRIILREEKGSSLDEITCIVARNLDVVQVVRCEEIPSYLLSSLKYKLHLPFESLFGNFNKSKLFLKWFNEAQDNIGMLVRLECKICDVDPDLSPRQEYSTIHWKGMIVKNPNDIRLPDINVKGQLQSYYFLLNGCSKTECTAYLLHSADQLNGGIIHRLASYENTLRKSDPGSKVNPHELLEDLPLFDVGDLWKMENDLMNLQSVALKNWIEKKDIQEKKCQISQNEIVELLTKVRSDYIDQFTTDRTCKLQLIKTMELEAMNLCSELDYNTGSDWIEKKALINKEALHKKFKRVKTEEMIFRGEVIRVPEAGTSVRLDVSEFLKYFKNSGKPVSDQSSPTNCVHSETCKPCTFSDPTTLSCASFKDAVQMHYHGIDYCLDSRNAEKINDRRLRIQARYITHETSSTCTLEQVASAATMLVPSPAAQASPQEASIEKEPRRTKSLTSSSHTIKTRNSTAKEELLQKRSVRSSPRRASMPRIKAIKQQDSKRSSSLSHQRSASVGSAQSRSNKHKQALRYTVDKTLKKHGIDKDHASYAQCVTRLYSLCKSFLKDLTSSHGLEQEMKAVAESNVAQVISFELRRSRKR